MTFNCKSRIHLNTQKSQNFWSDHFSEEALIYKKINSEFITKYILIRDSFYSIF